MNSLRFSLGINVLKYKARWLQLLAAGLQILSSETKTFLYSVCFVFWCPFEQNKLDCDSGDEYVN